jgi:hypothetical protein
LNTEANDVGARAADVSAGALVIPAPRQRLGRVVLEAKALTRTLPSGRILFKNVSFNIEPGSIVGVGEWRIRFFGPLRLLLSSSSASSSAVYPPPPMHQAVRGEGGWGESSFFLR